MKAKRRCYNVPMIGYLKGKVLQKFKAGKNVVTLTMQVTPDGEFGIGYAVLVTEMCGSTIPVQSFAELWTFAVHSENDSYLIGFSSPDKMSVFLDLLSVSGVGPRTAMLIVDSVGVEQIRHALVAKDVNVFSKVPGIGHKTAAKIVVELSGRGVDVANMLYQSNVQNDLSSNYADVYATLLKLGYSTSAAKEALQRAAPLLQANENKTTAEKVTLILANS